MNCSEDVLEYWIDRLCRNVDSKLGKEMLDKLDDFDTHRYNNFSSTDQIECSLFCQALQAQSLDIIATKSVSIKILLKGIFDLLEKHMKDTAKAQQDYMDNILRRISDAQENIDE